MTRIGNAVFLSMDVSDVFLSISLVARYLELERTKQIAFGALLIVWTALTSSKLDDVRSDDEDGSEEDEKGETRSYGDLPTKGMSNRAGRIARKKEDS
ncbi:hypothetical protein Clacol_008255 [Clathrus columnatus]|uniref:TLC domain-containing protein n=1 Tax=Clathrus columnatus TaxID=1419009 RepID=A0AAV5AKI0_9AGAM|nr:hypothetical protein Clacol_008255 [Clathrus columnatus]